MRRVHDRARLQVDGDRRRLRRRDPGRASARPSLASSVGAAAWPAEARAATAAAATNAASAFTDGRCTRTPPTAGAPGLPVDGDRDAAPAPGSGLGRAREPEVDDAALDGGSDVGGEARPVPRDVQIRAERDELRVDGDDALADGDAERGSAREVVGDRVDLDPVLPLGLRLTLGRADDAEERSDEDRAEERAPTCVFP